MKKMGINQKAVQLFDEVFVKGNRHDQIHFFGDYGLFLTYRNVPDFQNKKITRKAYIYIYEVYDTSTRESIGFSSFMDDFRKALDYMNKHDKSFREAFTTYANKLSLESKLDMKLITPRKRAKI
ncbi:hypothetical protein K6L09_20885 [Burkholderia cepacia]